MKMRIFLTLIIICLTSCLSSLSDEELNQKWEKFCANRDWNSAMKYLGEIIERNPNESEVYFARAIANSNMKQNIDYELMIDDLDQCFALNPSNSKSLLLRFQTNMKRGHYDSALDDIDKLIELKNDVPFFYSWKGNCAFISKRFELAEKAYDKRLNIPGDYEDMRNNYYYWMFSKYFGGNKDGAMWDCAFLPDRGFEEDTILMRLNVICNSEIMKVQCKNCLPKEGLEIPDFTNSEKLQLWNLKQNSSILAIKKLIDEHKLSNRDAKFVVMHINREYGHCNRCNFDKLNQEYIKCPKCRALNFNWMINKTSS